MNADAAPGESDTAPTPPGRGLRWGHVVGAAILAGIFALLSAASLWHSDVWGHALYGRWIVEHRALPESEPFTPYADKTLPLPQTQWLAQALYALTFSAGERLAGAAGDPARALGGGVEMLLALHIAAMTGFHVLFWLACCRVGGSAGWANVAVVLLFAGTLSASQYQRPQMLGMLCFAVLLFVASRPVTSRAAVAGLPALLALWANLHGSFVVGLAFLGLFTVSRVVGALAAGRGLAGLFRDPRVLRPASATVLSITAAALLNPHGPELYREVMTFADRPNVRLLDEWRPLELRPGAPGFWPFVVSAGLVALFWVAGGLSRTAVLVVAAPFAALPLMQQRTMTWWLPLAAWFLAAAGPSVTERLHVGRLVPPGRPGVVQTVLVGLIALAALAFWPPVTWALRGAPRFPGRTLSSATCWQLGLELRAAPETRGRRLPAFAEVTRAYPDGRFTGAIFASETMGDYLLTVAPAGSPVLLYSHAHAFPPDYFREAMAVKFAEGDWRTWLAERQVNLVVIEPDLWARLAAALRSDPAWVVVTDEARTPGARRLGDRKFIAVRKKPIVADGV